MIELPRESLPENDGRQEASPSELADIQKVGPDKPLGYVIESQINAAGTTVQKVRESCRERGRIALEFPGYGRSGEEQALYIADPESLQALLNANATVLSEAGWPTTPVEFVCQVATTKAATQTPLFNTVADAFADTANYFRTR